MIMVSRRRIIATFACLMLGFVFVIGSTAKVVFGRKNESILGAEENALRIEQQQGLRGSIYDANMEPLAYSKMTYEIAIAPEELICGNDAHSKETSAKINLMVRGLVDIAGADEQDIRSKILANPQSKYLLVKQQVERETLEELQRYMDENELNIYPKKDSKRVYPYDDLASTVLGFTGEDGTGLYGLEYYYESTLAGTDGKRVSSKNVLDTSQDAEYNTNEGKSIVLTIDKNIQNILEEALTNAKDYNGAKAVYGIVMQVKTGKILAMADLPHYDCNDPYTVIDPDLLAEIEEAELLESVAAPETGEAESPVQVEQEERKDPDTLYNEAIQSQWVNRSIHEFYEPGSVEKIFLAAAAFEEDVIDENFTYDCGGRITINYGAETRSIKDFYESGHGHETIVDWLVNSCNTFSVNVAVNKLGTEKYFKYFEAFGFTRKTGIDMQGEGIPKACDPYGSTVYEQSGTYYSPEISFTPFDLASASFGQTFYITPLQMITAVSAIGNGGKIMYPYVVSKVLDTNGNAVSETSPKMREQVVSQTTADRVKSIMREVTIRGTGKPTYVNGYSVCVKTGTSEKLLENSGGDRAKYIGSCAGFAPYDDPEIAVLIIIDEPSGGNYSGGDIATPIAGTVFSSVLSYLGIEPEYSEEELSNMTNPVPAVIGMSAEKAELAAEEAGFNVVIVGEGNSVISQVPVAGKRVYGIGTVVLYTEAGAEKKTAGMPQFLGVSLSEAEYLAKGSGFNIDVIGIPPNTRTGNLYVYSQSIDETKETLLGSTITLNFTTTGSHD